MSKYVDKPHGLVIGSDNIFFYSDEKGELQEFRSIVWARGFFVEDYSTAHTGIRTFAEQFIWDEWEEKVDGEPFKYEGEIITIPRIVTMRALTPYVKYWLDENAPGWGIRPPGKDTDPNPAIFFQKRKHALAFTKMVGQMLRGWSYI